MITAGHIELVTPPVVDDTRFGRQFANLEIWAQISHGSPNPFQ